MPSCLLIDKRLEQARQKVVDWKKLAKNYLQQSWQVTDGGIRIRKTGLELQRPIL